MEPRAFTFLIEEITCFCTVENDPINQKNEVMQKREAKIAGLMFLSR